MLGVQDQSPFLEARADPLGPIEPNLRATSTYAESHQGNWNQQLMNSPSNQTVNRLVRMFSKKRASSNMAAR